MQYLRTVLFIGMSLLTVTFLHAQTTNVTIDQTTTRTKDQLQRDRIVTGSNGQVLRTHSLDRTWNPVTKTGTVNASTQYANGKTTSRAGTITRNTNGSVTAQGTITGPNGKQATYTDTRTKTATGHITTNSITGPKGKTVDTTRTVTRTPPN